MQKKQSGLKQTIHYLTPWDDQFDVDNFLAPTINSPARKTRDKQAFKDRKYNFLNEEAQNNKTIEQKAKKTLLNLQYDSKMKQIQDLKYYIQSKNKGKNQHQMPSGIIQNKLYKLPPILRQHKTIDVYDQSLILKDNYNPKPSQQNIFKKYGQHRKSPYRQVVKVERSVSFGSVEKCILKQQNMKKQLSKELKEDMTMIDKPQKIKLRGKKYSCSERQVKSSKLTLPQLNYFPSQPIITPISAFFGHKKEDVLKNVLKQINHKIK